MLPNNLAADEVRVGTTAAALAAEVLLDTPKGAPVVAQTRPPGEGTRAAIVASWVLAAVCLAFVAALSAGWPRVGFEGALFMSGILLLAAGAGALVAIILSVVDARRRGQHKKALVWMALLAALAAVFGLLLVAE